MTEYESDENRLVRLRKEMRRYYRTSRKHAAAAARWYDYAASRREFAAWLMQHPDLWEPKDGMAPLLPADFEKAGDGLERLGDSYLRSYFAAISGGRCYRTLIRDLEARIARRNARADRKTQAG